MAKVLIVDDEAPIRALLRETLEREGFETDEAENGKAAMEVLRAGSEPFDIVMTDIMMPVQGGLGLIMSLRREFPDTAIVAMSGYSSAGLQDSLTLASQIGVRHCVSKPFERAEVVRILRDVAAAPDQARA